MSQIIFSSNNQTAQNFIYWGWTGPAPFIGSFSPANGASGTLITIKGSGFSSSSVTLGGVAAVVVSQSFSEIQAIAQFHSTGLVDVTVTNQTGDYYTLDNRFFYNYVPQSIPLIITDSGTVSHTWFNATNITSSVNEVWTKVGSPTFVSGVSGMNYGVKNLTYTAYFTSGTAGQFNNGQFADPHSHTIAFLIAAPSYVGTQYQFFTDGQGGGNGWMFRLNSNGFSYWRGSKEKAVIVPGFAAGKIYLLMAGVNGDSFTSDGYFQVNNVATSVTNNASDPGSKPMRIGTTYDTEPSVGLFGDGIFYEAYITTTSPTSASLSALYTQVSSTLSSIGVSLG